ncbi:MAG TPA: hypothetical protein VGB37_09715, partial [Candidatus Lokiarchaeia archaeon]
MTNNKFQEDEISKDTISQEEHNVVKSLEKEIGRSIPEIKRIDYHNFGFVVQERHIVGLSLFSCGLNVIP